METNTTNTLHWVNSLTFKLVIIGLMILLLLIPLSMIKSIISERETTSLQVENDISAQWGHAQVLAGPILNIPTEHSTIDKNGNVVIERNWLHIMPSNLNIVAHLEPEIRYRGIFKTAVYTSQSVITGDFKLAIKPEDIVGTPDWSKAVVTFGISDNRGIRGDIEILWNNKPLEAESGMLTQAITKTGFSLKTPLTVADLEKSIPFDIQLELSGSRTFAILPLGQKSNIDILSPWTNPSFSGNLLPQTRNISENGFDANWQLTHLNRNFPQYWQGSQFDVWEHSLGVDLFLPVNHYQKAMRSAKYGILFIVLTLLVFLFIELIKNKKVHLFQYLLVGLALILFFSLLTALSEHTGFNMAYLIASVVNIVVIGLFAYGLLQDVRLTSWVTGLLVIMYSFLFVLLQLNDLAFLAGNIGLVIILSVIMKASLKLTGQASR